MSNSDPFRTYLRELQKNLSTGVATEHTHRSALKALLEALGDGVRAINEPKRVECGAPDYIITRTQTPIGYVEAKDVGTSLDTEERSEQMRRYRASLNNLILTDYLEFRWYVEASAGRRLLAPYFTGFTPMLIVAPGSPILPHVQEFERSKSRKNRFLIGLG